MKKSNKKWFKADFGSECERRCSPPVPISHTNKPTKENNSKSVKTKRDKNFNFLEQLIPKEVSELAVHPKKIKELEDWLQDAGDRKKQTCTSSFLLLTGPTGSGKTIALNVVCKKLGISVVEWTNPVDQDFEYTFTVNQITRFTEFLAETNKYSSLFDAANDSRRVVLIEDFPNVVIKNPEEFVQVLDACSLNQMHPIVFICTDSIVKKGIELSHLLFPQEVRDKYGIHTISFNACAGTIMKTALRRAQKLVQDNPDRFKPPSSTIIDAIIASSMGDIRCAINQYHMASLIGCHELPTIKTAAMEKKRKRGAGADKSSKVESMIRDESLGIFHGLGRVLNPKRREAGGDSWRLQCDVEKIVDEFTYQPHKFVSFLFENYVRYFGEMKDVSKASEILSLAEIFLNNWSENRESYTFALWLSILGVMVFNEHKLSRWMPIRGPRRVEAVVKTESRRKNYSVTDLYYYDIINGTCSYKFTS